MRVVCFALYVLGSLPSALEAGPDDTVKHLMNDSASMLDFGLLRLDLILAHESLGTSYYLWDQNQIVIAETFFDTSSRERAEKTCAEWISDVRKLAFVRQKDGKPVFESSRFSDFLDTVDTQQKINQRRCMLI